VRRAGREGDVVNARAILTRIGRKELPSARYKIE